MKRTLISPIPSEQEIELFDSTLQKLKTVFPSEYAKSFNFDFNGFNILQGYYKIDSGPTIDINIGYENCFVSFLQMTSRQYTGKYPETISNEFYSFGVCLLKQNFGHLIIRPETFTDKIHEFLNPVEIDFEEDKEFSSKFYVVADEKLNSSLNITDKFRNAILEIKSKDFVIEIINDRLIIGDKKLINPETVLDFAIFQNKIVSK